jgi:L-threonylcarbamoyladenylate synthase
MIPESVIQPAVDCIRSGGTLLYPTDTVWGLGCNAMDPSAVQKIFDLKNRSQQQPMLVLVDDLPRLQAHVGTVPNEAIQLMQEATRPVTIVYPSAIGLPDLLVSADRTIAIRVTSDEFCQQLISAADCPIVSTSANISGEPFPTSFDTVDSAIISGVDHVAAWRQDDVSEALPSSILKLDNSGKVSVIRE